MPLNPGEITRAHCGVLFLDELPEFARGTLEALRQPLEEGSVELRRAHAGIQLPAKFQLIVAMNPCPCGMLGHPTIPCRDTPKQVAAYRSRISGPLLDRIDIRLSLHAVDPSVFPEERDEGMTSSTIRQRVAELHALARERNGGCLNAALDERVLRRQLASKAKRLLLRNGKIDALSARSILRILRVARSAADIAGRDSIDDEAIAQALHYRMRDS